METSICVSPGGGVVVASGDCEAVGGGSTVAKKSVLNLSVASYTLFAM